MPTLSFFSVEQIEAGPRNYITSNMRGPLLVSTVEEMRMWNVFSYSLIASPVATTCLNMVEGGYSRLKCGLGQYAILESTMQHVSPAGSTFGSWYSK